MNRAARIVICLLPVVAVVGCEAQGGTEGGSVQGRQDSALKDLFGYGPSSHDPKKAPHDLSSEHPGDGTAKSEWDRFWNP
jgi:hypothetical protein